MDEPPTADRPLTNTARTGAIVVMEPNPSLA